MDTQYILSQKAEGFTLIELIVTVVIVGILFAAGIPGMTALLGNVSQSASAEKLLNSLAYARGESVARVTDVSLAAIGGERIGWNVFIDNDSDCVFNSATEELLRVVDITADNVTIISESTCIGFNELGENRANTAINLTIGSPTASASDVVVSVSPNGYAGID